MLSCFSILFCPYSIHFWNKIGWNIPVIPFPSIPVSQFLFSFCSIPVTTLFSLSILHKNWKDECMHFSLYVQNIIDLGWSQAWLRLRTALFFFYFSWMLADAKPNTTAIVTIAGNFQLLNKKIVIFSLYLLRFWEIIVFCFQVPCYSCSDILVFLYVVPHSDHSNLSLHKAKRLN